MLSIRGYTFTQQLSVGERTIVYAGRRDRDDAPVVAKLCRNPRPGPREQALLRHEFAILRELDMPELGAAFGLEPHGMGLALIRERLDGTPLDELLAHTPDGRLPLSSALTIGINLASTLDKLHRRRVIHKDVKPSNVLVKPDTLETALIDFGIATRLTGATQAAVSPDSLEGTIAYMSPEQTGRMNRVVDHRSDLYMLGATLYEMVTGSRPFTSTSTLELIHSHIARMPAAPRELDRAIPSSVSAIIMKLLAKSVDDRYQSGYGLERDLRRCLERARAGDPGEFELGRDDVPTQLRIPQKLYGREDALRELQSAYSRASGGSTQLLMIAGHPGAGKSSLVQEVHTSIATGGGYFISGKYEQLQRSVPYAPLLAALGGLLRQFLGESDEQLARWRARILEAVGSSGGVMTAVLPALELVIGPQPVPPALDPTAAQNRFNLVFQNFIHSLSSPSRPLVLFLDDLQWADPASLALIERFATGEDDHALLIIGAYRPTEVAESHSLRSFLDKLDAGAARSARVELTSLGVDAVATLLADTLRQPVARVQELAALIQQKTDGNPLFIRTFLQSVYEDGLLSFDSSRGVWTWRLDAIRASQSTANVVELMANKIARLPRASQRALQHGACFGYRFELRQLASLLREPAFAVARSLWPAIEAGLLMPLGSDYRFFHHDPAASGERSLEVLPEQLSVSYEFFHDRVREAAEARLEQGEQLAAHRQIGRLLLLELQEDRAGLFDVVGHLNRAAALISSPSERRRLARLNHEAGLQARSAAAYQAAARHFELACRQVVEDQGGEPGHHDFVIELHADCAESYSLCRRFDEARALLRKCRGWATTKRQHSRIGRVSLLICLATGDMGQAINIATETLQRLGVDLPTGDRLGEAVTVAMAKVERFARERSLYTILDRSPLADPDVMDVLSILVATSTAGYTTNPKLHALINLTGILLTLEHGPSEYAAFAFVNYGLALSGMERYKESLHFCKLGLALLERYPSPALVSKVYVGVSACAHYGEPLAETIPRCRQAVTMGMETGDFTYASYGVFYALQFRLAAGDHLNAIAEELASFEKVIQQTQNKFASVYLPFLKQLIRNYAQGTRGPVDLSDGDFDEDAFFAQIKGKGYASVIFRYCVFKLQQLYLAERYGDALAVTETAEKYAGAASGSLDLTELHFYKCLILLALAREEEYAGYKRSRPWDASARLVRNWATSCPENFQHKALLITAEESFVTGDEFAALNLYDRAIELAQTHSFHHHVALAYKLAAKFHLARRRTAAARGYFGQAYRAYLRWGAARKAAELAASYPELVTFETAGSADAGMVQLPAASSSMTSMRIDEIWERSHAVSDVTTTNSSSTTGTSGTALDLEAVLKASRALSGEMELKRLLARLMELLLESAGAERGFLILPKSGELFIEASGTVAGASDTRAIDVTESIPVKRCEQLSRAIVNYVARTNENIVISDASKSGHFAADPYIAEAQPRSVLCTPLVHQGKQIGLLYLENNLTADAFTLDRLRVLYILSAQAAISIDNARLYASITKSERKFRSLFEDSHDAIVLTNRAGDLLEANRATLELFGYSPEELSTLPGARLYVDVENIRDFRSELERLGAIRDYEVTLRKKDGAKVDCMLTAAAVRLGDDEREVGFQVIIRDITERKRAAKLLADYNRTLERTVEERTQEVTAKNAELSATLEELEKTQDQLILNEKMASLGTLSAGVAHELKNPLNFINNFAALSLRSTGEFNEDFADVREELDAETIEIIEEYIEDISENLETIQSHGKRADGIIQSMLFHARSHGGPAQPTDINALLSAELNLAYHGMRVKIEGFDLEMETEYDPALPQLPVVPQDLSRVFLNVMNNGIYAAWEKMGAAAEGFAPKLRVRTRALGDHVEVRIFDNGTGIPEDIRAKIFTPFFTSKPPGKGTGLGLSLSHDIVVRKYGGSIRVESEVGEYTEFVITLPTRMAVAAEPDA